MSQGTLGDPYWWVDADFSGLGGNVPQHKVDVVVIGSGFTGASAALELALAGRSVVVLEQHRFGYGASSRNFGYIGGAVGPHRAAKGNDQRSHEVAQAYGRAAALVTEIVERENIDVSIRTQGFAVLAHGRDPLPGMRTAAGSDRGKTLGARFYSQDELGQIIASDRFAGALVNPRAKALHPARYVAGLLRAAKHKGATLVQNAEALSVSGARGAWTVATPKGHVVARDVLFATGGHTGKVHPFLRRRLLPVHGTVIATEDLGEDTVRELLPKLNWCVDTQFGFLCFRPSPDARRLIFAKAGLPGSFTKPLAPYVKKVRLEMLRTFPQLAHAKIEYAWPASVDVTFDGQPHLGEHDGIFHAAGYNGSGVPMATYLGQATARRLMGQSYDRTFDTPFKTNPLYHGSTWFMPGLRLMIRAMGLKS